MPHESEGLTVTNPHPIQASRVILERTVETVVSKDGYLEVLVDGQFDSDGSGGRLAGRAAGL